MEDIENIVLELLNKGFEQKEIRMEFIKNAYNTNGEPISIIIKRLIREGKITKEEILQKRKLRNNLNINAVETPEIAVSKQSNKTKEDLYFELKPKILEMYKAGIIQKNIATKLSSEDNKINSAHIATFFKRMREDGIITETIEKERKENLKIQVKLRQDFYKKMNRYKNKLRTYELKKNDLIQLRENIESRTQYILIEDIMFAIKAHTQLFEFDDLIEFLQSILVYLGEQDAEEVKRHIEKILQMKQDYNNKGNGEKQENITAYVEEQSID